VTLEGPDGSGKSTLSQRLGARLADEGFETVVTREPGGTALGEEVRQIVLHAPILNPAPATDVLLFNAARAQLVAQVIEPALARGAVVICDRFADSTLAYQGYGSGQPLAALRAIGSFATDGLVPDLTFLLDLPVEEGLGRKGLEVNRFETGADLDFHRRVREGFLAIAAGSPDRFVVVDATRAPDDLETEIVAELLMRLSRTPALARASAAPNAPAPAAPAPAEKTGSKFAASISRRSEPKRHSVRMDR